MRKLPCLIFAFLFAVCAVAQPTGMTFRHITVEDGLSSNHVRSLMQDRFGFIWIGTDEDLNRYDGRTVRIFDFPERWSAATILSIVEDESVIWIGTDKGLFSFSYETQSIDKVEVATDDGTFLDREISSISRDNDGNLWLSTMGQGVFRYNPQQSVAHRFDFPLCTDRVACVYVDRVNQVWALTNWGGPILSRLNKTKEVFEDFPLMFKGKRIEYGGIVLLEDSRQRFWIGSWTDGLYEIDRVTGHVTKHLTPDKVEVGINHIHSLIEYNQGQIAIGSDDGILMYDVSDGTTEYFMEGFAASVGLSNRFVYPLLKDREGGLWAGTYYGGVL